MGNLLCIRPLRQFKAVLLKPWKSLQTLMECGNIRGSAFVHLFLLLVKMLLSDLTPVYWETGAENVNVILYVSRGTRLLNLGIFYNYRSSPHF
jgi:hypothetical protein